jgi:prepilin-type N-terminal cleavage/methylation domain-containing protein/prepilin-type processing-associated H-X9-DG protein
MKSRSGFTLVELLLVIAVIAILAALLFSAIAVAKTRARQTACANNFKQMGVAIVMYTGDYNLYPGCLDAPEPFYYVWMPRLLSLMSNNRKAFSCPAAPASSAWDTNANKSLGGVNPATGLFDPFSVRETTQFSVGYNDWGIHYNNGGNVLYRPQLGLGGDVTGVFTQGLVRDSAIKKPSDMIEIGDVPAGPLTGTPIFNASINPADTSAIHTGCPANRHNYRTDLVFCDGHVEAPKRNDIRDPQSASWRSAWNNDNNPHFELGYWVAHPGWENILDH